jgi:C_GCAxxG_C_C family probable redox protein
MWEAYDWGNEDLLWASTAFNGGIAGQQQAPCGAVSSATVVLGLRHRRPLADKDKAEQARLKAREEASGLVRAFTRKYGTIVCRDLLGVDFSKPDEYQRFRESGIAREKCDKYVQFVIEKMYELENNRAASSRQKTA